MPSTMAFGRILEDVKPDGSFGKFDAEIPELLAEVGMARGQKPWGNAQVTNGYNGNTVLWEWGETM